MKWENFPALVVAYTAALFGFMGFVGGNLSAQKDIDWINWIGATDGWFAGFVGAVTVFAILMQIRSQSEDTHKQATEAKELFGADIERLIHQMNHAWKIAEDLHSACLKQEDVDGHIDWLKKKVIDLNEEIEKHPLHEHIEKMLPKDRARCQKIVSKLAEATSAMWDIRLTGDPGVAERYEVEGQEYVEYLILTFDELRDLLRDFYPELTETFGNRAQPPVHYPRDISWVHFLRSGMPTFPKNNRNPL